MLKFDMDFNVIGTKPEPLPTISTHEQQFNAKMAEFNIQHSKNIMQQQSIDALRRSGGDNIAYQSEMKIIEDMHKRRING